MLPTALYTRSLVIDVIGLNFEPTAAKDAAARNGAAVGAEGAQSAAAAAAAAAAAEAAGGKRPAAALSRLFLGVEMASKSCAKFSSVV